MNIAESIKAQLTADLLELVALGGRLAAERGQNLYLVGGVVRDALLGKPNLDVDLVLEGNAPALARQLGKRGNWRVTIHRRFGTATLRRDNLNVDIVSARSETYAHPGALPTVATGNIEDDLFRRDFSINAMAVRLDPERFGELVDPHGGRRDVDRGIVRVLHDESFRDDATRIWRALRYEQRLGFRLHPDTEVLLLRDVGMMATISGDRLRNELERTLEERKPERTLYRLGQVGALEQLAPGLDGNGWLAERFELARQASPDRRPDDVVYYALMVWRLKLDAVARLIHRLNFGAAIARVLRDIPGVREAVQSLEERKRLPSEISRLLENHQLTSVFVASLSTDSMTAWQQIDLYLSTLRFVVPSLNGDDLKQMGVPPGRRLGTMLRALRAARLDGTVSKREDEVDLVRRWLGEDVV